MTTIKVLNAAQAITELEPQPACIALGGKMAEFAGAYDKRRLFFARTQAEHSKSLNSELKPVADIRPSPRSRQWKAVLRRKAYIASRQIATAVYLAQQIEKPILVEGPAGVGKTSLRKRSPHGAP